MSKDLFLMMREHEVATSNFLPTKKDIQQSSKQFANDLVESGEYDIKEVYSQSIRLKEALNVIEKELKNSLPEENFNAFGLKAIYRNGGDTINFEDDEVYRELKYKLKSREELLRAALKTNEVFYDSEGVEVPKVSKTPRKSGLSISF